MYDSINQRLFFTSTKLGSGGTIWALDAKDTPTSSRVLWSRDIGDSDSSLSFTENTALASIYVGTNSGRLYKLNAATGVTCWGSTADSCTAAGGSEQFFCADPAVNARATSCSAGSAIQKGLLVMFDAGRVVFSTADGNVRLLSNAGVQQWRTNISGASAPLATKSIGTGFVYVGSNTGLVYQLALATGAVTATRSVGGGSVVAGNPSLDVVAKRLYVTTSQGNLYAFNVPF
jgi:outer membrane protein assembly factor BamB